MGRAFHPVAGFLTSGFVHISLYFLDCFRFLPEIRETLAALPIAEAEHYSIRWVGNQYGEILLGIQAPENKSTHKMKLQDLQVLDLYS